MPLFEYSGQSILGEPVRGRCRAIDPTSLKTGLFRRGVSLHEYRLVLSRLDQFVLKFRDRTEVTKVSRQIALLLESKITINESIGLANSQVRSRQLRLVLGQVTRDLEFGMSVEAAFARYPILFDGLFTSIIKAGEISGDLEPAFRRIAEYRERYDEFVKKLRSSLSYPALVLSVALLVVFAVVFYIVPIFSSLYENFGAELPALTKLMISWSSSLKSGFTPLFLTLAASVSVVTIWVLASRFRRATDRFLLRVPVLGDLLVKLITARYCRTLGSLLVANVDIIFALEVASKTSGNSYVASLLTTLQDDLVKGKEFTKSLEQLNLFPGVMLKMSAAGEKTGKLGEMLLRSASYYESESERDVTTITSLLEPMVIIALGLVIGFILIALYLPLFSLVGRI